MTKQITIAVASSLLGALLAFLGSSAMGLFHKTISDSQILGVAQSIVDNENYRGVFLEKMEKSGKFKGPQGMVGPKGLVGPPGPPGPGIKALAIVSVKGGKIESSSKGVSYDSKTGIVSFPNPENLKFIPLIADIGDTYMTETHFIRNDFVSPNQFKVWRTPLDVTARNQAPGYFTAIAIGF